MKILIADDEVKVRSAFKKLLHEENYQVITAIDGRDAVTKHRRYHSDFIFMDMQMPKWNGLIASQKIRAFDPIVPIVALTNYLDEYQEKDSTGSVDHWVQKSNAIFQVNIEYLLELIKSNNRKVFQSSMDEWVTNLESSDFTNEKNDYLKAIKCLKNLMANEDISNSIDRLLDFTTMSAYLHLGTIFKKSPKDYYKLIKLMQNEMPEQHIIKSKLKETEILKIIEDYDVDMKKYNILKKTKLN